MCLQCDMKRVLLIFFLAVLSLSVSAQDISWHDASELTIIGKPIPTSEPFTRIDGSVYKFNDKTIDLYAGYSTGLAILFETDSQIIKARWTTGPNNASKNMTAIVCKGLDLYIMKEGEWVFAGVGAPSMKKAPYGKHEDTIVSDMAEGTKQCLLYLPLFDEVTSLEIGVEDGSVIRPMENPFHGKIIVHGSSITHGASASRPGMTYPARFGRDNGMYTCNLGFSGMCKLQKEYAEYLADIKDVDAFIFDTFSNPQADVINEKFDEFVDIVRAAHPDVPMIFLQTERRETRNFSTKREASESAKQEAAEAVVKRRMKTDKHMYFISSEEFLGREHIATVDGVHPTDLGFTYMLESITPKILKILKKYKAGSSKEVCVTPYDVKVGGKSQALNVVKEQYHEGEYYWSRFDCKGKVKLTVDSQFDLNDVKVIANKDVEWSVKDGRLVIKADGPFKAVVEPKGRIKPLLLFADKPEGETPAGESVLYFGPGEHNVGLLPLTDDQIVYIAEGAVVNGAIHAIGKNITICGRGVLSGAVYPRLEGPCEALLLADRCNNLVIRDVTFVAPWWWTLYLVNCDGALIDNIKILNSNMINDDGIDIANSRNVVVRNSFIRCQDDVIAVKGMDQNGLPCENILIEDSMLWNDWANIIRIGYECEAPYMKNIVLRNCDIVHYAFRYKEPERFWANTIFFLQPSNNMLISDLLFEDIRVHADGPIVFLKASSDICVGPGILGLAPQNYSHVYAIADLSKYKYDAAGALKDVVFRNISVEGDAASFHADIYIQGRTETENISNLIFENVTFFGKPIKDSEALNLYVGEYVDEPIFVEIK